MLEDIAGFGSPVVLFSGGEPLTRADTLELLGYASQKGLRAVLSTNGTLITREVAKKLEGCGLSYVGISLDGVRETNDRFRATSGAFDEAMEGLRNCREVGLKVGLRFTMNRHNVQDIPAVFDLIESEGIPRVCFYHLVFTGRGSKLIEEDLDHVETRRAVDLIMDRTRHLHNLGQKVEVLTVDNHADGPYLYLRLHRENQQRAEDALTLLRMNGGNSSGVGIGCVSWDGWVYADQFWRNHPIENVRHRPFSEIWSEPTDALLASLKERKPLLKGRCRSCCWLDVCNGNFRARAEAKTGDPWAPDPACYLTDKEIGV
jgi:radical SAM protein with 4Fe4S-binding SPASM domain